MDLSLELIEEQLKNNLKEKNQLAVDTLRSLKTRIQNEQISKGSSLSSEEIQALVKSEVKRRKEAAEAFIAGGREDSAKKEQQEIEVLSSFLPEQMTEDQLRSAIQEKISSNGWTVSDFGKAMGALKQEFGNSADGALMASVLKESLK